MTEPRKLGAHKHPIGPGEPERIRDLGRAVIATEAAAVSALAGRIDERFVEACRYMLACQGRIVVLGMGKSGHVGGKIAATLASTGSPAFFVHPGEASHGDLGMITPQDVVLALSNSGETAEILTILPIIKRLGVPLIALTGRPGSTLAREANVSLDVSVAAEACPLGLAPTSSTTATLAMGDALAIASWRRAALPPMISPAPTLPGASADGCCSMSRISCTRVSGSPRSGSVPRCSPPWRRCPARDWA